MNYKIFKGKDGLWYVTLIASNGEVLFRSGDGYVDVRDAYHSIDVLRARGLQIYPVDGEEAVE